MDQSQPIIDANDISVQILDASSLGDSDIRIVPLHGRNQAVEIATRLPPPHRFVRKAVNKIKLCDPSLLSLSYVNIKTQASQRLAAHRQLIESSVKETCKSAERRTTISPRIRAMSSPPYE